MSGHIFAFPVCSTSGEYVVHMFIAANTDESRNGAYMFTVSAGIDRASAAPLECLGGRYLVGS